MYLFPLSTMIWLSFCRGSLQFPCIPPQFMLGFLGKGVVLHEEKVQGEDHENNQCKDSEATIVLGPEK